jgi:UDP:flavonoid glycosyltransferase YjiC (YdhE family)
MTTAELFGLLEEARKELNDYHGNDGLVVRIERALDQKHTIISKLTEHQQEWIVRLARAAVMWGSRAGSLYTIGLLSANPENFTAAELANRVFAEIGIEGRFTMPSPPTPPRKARGSK